MTYILDENLFTAFGSRFIPASRGISSNDLLAVVGTYTGTVALYEVYDGKYNMN